MLTIVVLVNLIFGTFGAECSPASVTPQIFLNISDFGSFYDLKMTSTSIYLTSFNGGRIRIYYNGTIAWMVGYETGGTTIQPSEDESYVLVGG